MHPLSGALPLLYVPKHVTFVLWLLTGTGLHLLTVELLSTAEPLCPLSLWNDLSDSVFDGQGLVGFKSRADTFLLAYTALSFCLLPFYIFLPSMG